jgi:UDP-N-acetylglucosamine:LPS N-acetylglucosamine transferase
MRIWSNVLPQSLTICIYFFATGGGHGSAAEAIKAGIESVIKREASTDVNLSIISQPIPQQSHVLIGCLIALYNYLARHRSTWVKYYYHLLHMLRLESNLYYGLYSASLHDLLKTQQPSLIVAVHPMLAEALAHARHKLNMDHTVKIAVVVTDPNERLWRAWACKRADLIIAPNEIVRTKLLSWGIEAAKIQVLGMPVHPEFLSPPLVSPAEFLSKLGLSANIFTVCINSGWAGNAHLLDTYLALAKCSRKVQAIFLSGHNKKLYENAVCKEQEINIPSAVLPFYDQMSYLMSAVDVMVTKPGGLTTYQALARRMPLVFDNTIEPMPQEAPTMQMLVNCGIASKLNKPEDIAQIIDSMEFRSREKKPLPETYQLNLTDKAIFNIARSLLRLYDPKIISATSEMPPTN